MLRRSDDKIRDAMDAIVMPKKWHHLCVAINGASNMVQGVAVCIRKQLCNVNNGLSHRLIQDGDILESEKIGENDKASVERESFQKLKANNCTHQLDTPCTDSAGTVVADIGIWDRALSHEEMVGWSLCR